MIIEIFIPNFHEIITTEQCLQIIYDEGVYVYPLDKISYIHSVDGVLHITVQRDDTIEQRMNYNTF